MLLLCETGRRNRRAQKEICLFTEKGVLLLLECRHRRRIQNILKKIYYDASHPAGFGLALDLYEAVRRQRKNVTFKQVEGWLKAQDAHILHRKIVRKFPRRKFVSKGLNHIWQSDLANVQKIQKENNGRRFLLTAIDIFSRQAYAQAIKSKKPADVIAAFNKILKQAKTKPKFLHTDRGTEYTNRKFLAWLEGKSIRLYHTFNAEIKASSIERWHRTLKNKMFKYFTAKNTLHYLSVLPRLVSAYNNRKHRSLGMAPSEVNPKNEKLVWDRQYKQYLEGRDKRFRFRINDVVRITKVKGQFQHGYQRGWTREKF